MRIKVVSTEWLHTPDYFIWVRERVAPFDQSKAAAFLEMLGLDKEHAEFLADPDNEVKTGQDGEDLTLEFTPPNQ